ncbi:DUF547 domain-containing protein [Vibrio aestuarianus]|uniref:DUF547 domain-containing protein n=1 Tax=Vibrio aestuarianus TaxID=28171 RepID=A0A9X4ISB0_9VIBR|nr:DUF547 domain-containing protein [Vibrio aestuarianus]MDE1240840.1 DUF547 domain-containing protein [Vibrio aestuarianus]
MKYLLALCLTISSTNVLSAPKSKLWDYWNHSNEESTQTISHQVWQTTLDSYLIKDNHNNLFDYKNVNSKDKTRLEQYISQLSKLDPREYTKAEQYAYWVNLYNALTVNLVVDNYPISSITKLRGLFSFGPWEQKIITINQKELTLNDIEHRILRPIWKDPRTHYAINCASLGCPNLQEQAFTAKNTQPLLEKSATEFINSKKGVKLTNDKLVLSSIYDWFSEDFGTKQQLFQHLARYNKTLKDTERDVSYQYDWKLNDVR